MLNTANKFVISVGALMLAVSTHADTTFYPTYPGTTIRDVNKPGYVQQGNNIYQTYPGTDIPNVTKPGFTRNGDAFYQTYPGTNIPDVGKPGVGVSGGN
jgi:hypothetical protein